MKKSLVCITLGLIIGLTIGKEAEEKKEEIIKKSYNKISGSNVKHNNISLK